MSRFEVIQFPNANTLAHAAAKAWLDEVESANHHEKAHLVALSGGRIANDFFAAITQQAKARGVSMAHVHFFWADERCVPPTDAESNYKIAHDLLFVPLNIPEFNVHRIRGEESPEVAAKKAAEEIADIAPLDPDGQPVLDVIFLGIGPDGHTASLFPGEPETLRASKAIFRAIKNSPKPPPNRVTLGFPAIVAAKQAWFLVSGGGKEEVFADSLKPSSQTPFGKVLQMRKFTKIFCDLPVK